MNQAAFRIAQTIIEAGEKVSAEERKKNPHAVALGRLGGKKGGPARAAKLTAEQRRASALKAIRARWGKRAKTPKRS